MQLVILALVVVAVVCAAIAVFGYGHQRSGPWRSLGAASAIGALAAGYLSYKLKLELPGLAASLASAIGGAVAALLGHTGQPLQSAASLGKLKP
jgi:uncharacterized membrane protein YjjB (DUF3815 family)